MELPLALKNNIINFLMSFMYDSDSQRALIYRSGLDAQLQEQIPFGKPPAQFVPLLISVLLDYGTLKDGRYAIEAILGSLQK